MKFKKSILLLGALVIGAQQTAQALSWHGIQDTIQSAKDSVTCALNNKLCTIWPPFDTKSEYAKALAATTLGIATLRGTFDSIINQIPKPDVVVQTEPFVRAYIALSTFLGAYICTVQAFSYASEAGKQAWNQRIEEIITKITNSATLSNADISFISKELPRYLNRYYMRNHLNLFEALINHPRLSSCATFTQQLTGILMGHIADEYSRERLFRMSSDTACIENFLKEHSPTYFKNNNDILHNDLLQADHPSELFDSLLAEYVMHHANARDNSQLLATLLSQQHLLLGARLSHNGVYSSAFKPRTIRALSKKLRDADCTDLKNSLVSSAVTTYSLSRAQYIDTLVTVFPELKERIRTEIIEFSHRIDYTSDDNIQNKDFFDEINQELLNPERIFKLISDINGNLNKHADCFALYFIGLHETHPIFLRNKLMESLRSSNDWDMFTLEHLLTNHPELKDELTKLAQEQPRFTLTSVEPAQQFALDMCRYWENKQ